MSTLGVFKEPSSIISMVFPGANSILSGRSLNTGARDSGLGWARLLFAFPVLIGSKELL